MTGITSITRDWGIDPSIVRIISSDALATVSASNYILNQAANIIAVNNGQFEWKLTDFVLVHASNGWGLFTISANFHSLNAYAIAPASVIGTPVVVGDFAVFQSTSGNLEDLGYLPSDPAQTNVVMQVGASVTNNLPGYNDANGSLFDTGIAYSSVLTSGITLPDVAADLIWHDVVVGQAALAASGHVALQASSAAKQYKIRNIQLNSGGTNFSGGGGDRDLAITDGTTVYSVIPAATLQALVNAGWGISADVPFPAAAAINVSSVAGLPIYAVYANGTLDYSAGSLVISIEVERVA